MTPRAQPQAPVSPAYEVLHVLHSARLLPPRRLRRVLAEARQSRLPEPADLLRPLQEAGDLTAFQVAQILAGRGQRLRLGPYVLLEPLGSGGMGQVFRAVHRVMNRLVAIKVIGRRAEASEKQTLERFRREAQAAAALCHPHVVTTHDACVDRGVLFLVMELLPGVDLHRRLRAGPLPWRLACEIARQAALGLHYIHERGLLHHDLKPSNLMLLDEGTPQVKLLDFGLACRMGRRRPQGLQGSVDFLAPERGADPDGADPRSDLYSLGCTLYFLLTGTGPFPGGSWTEKLLGHRLDPTPEVRDLRPDVPAALAALLTRLLAKEPSDRPASAADLATELTDLVAPAERVASVPPAPLPHSRSWRRPGLRAMTMALATGLLLVWGGQALFTRAAPWSGGTRLSGQEDPSPTGSLQPREEPDHLTPARPFHVAAGNFATLDAAVLAAGPEGVVSIDADGPVLTPALDCDHRAITLRAAPGRRPCLVLASRPGAAPWQGLLRSAAPLRLEAVDLMAEPDPTGGPLLEGTDTVIHLSSCRLSAPGRPVAVALRRGTELVLTDCLVEGGAVALSVEVGSDPCRLALSGSSIRADADGSALSVWAAALAQPGPARVELHNGTFDAGLMLALHGLSGGVTVTARSNTFRFRQGVVDAVGRREAWRSDLHWAGSANRYCGTGPWLRVDGEPGPSANLTTWRSLWATDEIGSAEEPLSPAG
jgi:serine/threonine protein kinase